MVADEDNINFVEEVSVLEAVYQVSDSITVHCLHGVFVSLRGYSESVTSAIGLFEVQCNKGRRAVRLEPVNYLVNALLRWLAVIHHAVNVRGPTIASRIPHFCQFLWIYLTAVDRADCWLFVECGFLGVSRESRPEIQRASPTTLLQSQPDWFGSVVEFNIVISAVVIKNKLLLINWIPERVGDQSVAFRVQACQECLMIWPGFTWHNGLDVL